MGAEMIGSASECSSAIPEITKMLNDEWWRYQSKPRPMINVYFDGEVSSGMEESFPKGCFINNVETLDTMKYADLEYYITVKWNNGITGTPSYKSREICLSGIY